MIELTEINVEHNKVTELTGGTLKHDKIIFTDNNAAKYYQGHAQLVATVVQLRTFFKLILLKIQISSISCLLTSKKIVIKDL